MDKATLGLLYPTSLEETYWAGPKAKAEYIYINS